ncbi:MAG TPA: stress response translation initiation inhibitor YciH, partial [Candidatus Altiarchaeales archaeon]|nr:stress response translation initiation inhibitor YciH [Candidatus Altiarchaeales archaeon]
GRIARELKQKLACGGTTKNDRIELQGDHVQRVKKVLKEIGFAEDMIEIT